MVHEAWDSGSIADGFAEVFGEGIRSIIANKTTKTLCGKRVSMDKISNGHATCEACRAELQRCAEGAVILSGYQKAFDAFGFEYANSLTREELIAAASL